MTNKRNYIIAIVALAVCAAVFASLYFYGQFVSTPQKNYDEAVSFYEMKNYEAAEVKFKDLGSYKDAADYLVKISDERTYDQAVKAFEAEDYAAAKELFSQIGDFAESRDYMEKIESAEKYAVAKAAYENEDYDTAEQGFSEIEDYSDSEDYIRKINTERIYQEASALYEQKQYTAARELFVTIPDYSDVNEIVAKMDADIAYNDSIDQLAEYGSGAERVAALSSSLIDRKADIWNKCANQESSEETDPYTKDSYGEFHEDPNTALTVFSWSDEYAQAKDEIISERLLADGQYEALKNLPASLSECAGKAYAMHSASSSLADLALDTTGDITVSAEAAKELNEAFDSAYESFGPTIPEKILMDADAALTAETEAEIIPTAETEAEIAPATAETEAEIAPVKAETEAEIIPTAETEAEAAPLTAQTEAEIVPTGSDNSRDGS